MGPHALEHMILHWLHFEAYPRSQKSHSAADHLYDAIVVRHGPANLVEIVGIPPDSLQVAFEVAVIA